MLTFIYKSAYYVLFNVFLFIYDFINKYYCILYTKFYCCCYLPIVNWLATYVFFIEFIDFKFDFNDFHCVLLKLLSILQVAYSTATFRLRSVSRLINIRFWIFPLSIKSLCHNFLELFLATTTMLLTTVWHDHVTSFNYDGKNARDVGFSCWGHLSNLMLLSSFHERMGRVISYFFVFLLFVCLFVCF